MARGTVEDVPGNVVARLRHRDDARGQRGDSRAVESLTGDKVVHPAHVALTKDLPKCARQDRGWTRSIYVAHCRLEGLQSNPEAAALVAEQPSPAAQDHLLAAATLRKRDRAGACDQANPAGAGRTARECGTYVTF